MKKITKKEYEKLLKWALNEIDEWKKFIKLLKKNESKNEKENN